MFGRKKKQKEAQEIKKQATPTVPDNQIHVMPERFYQAPKKSQAGLVITLIVILVLIGLGVGGYFLYISFSQGTGPVNQNTNQPVTNTNQEPVNTNQPVNNNANVNQNINVNSDTDEPVVTSTATTTPVNTNTNTNVNTNTNTNTNTPAANQPVDTDSDGLTDAEEVLFNSDPTEPDSDGDGFLDGQEVLNGFDPSQIDVTLNETNTLTLYSHPSYGIRYPQPWRLRELGSAKSEVLFQAATGEFAQVLVVKNPSGQSLESWYQQQFPGSPVVLLTEVNINGIPGLRTADTRNYYFANPQDPTEIYMVTYNLAGQPVANFITTFQAMVKSFSIVPSL